ncbi:hypothetical protein AVEN_211720-1 [Araneus ventricosus]|uniref:Uncharacterized protein n=1 Tax=Araneus ventricosus TaxID=182803 RepID=A0A4Y2R579_ARAVE|nr:hypothetical protein AVEN_211720-1 [Araneus ventricosus]
MRGLHICSSYGRTATALLTVDFLEHSDQVSKVCKVKEFWFTLALRFDIHLDDTKLFIPQPPPDPNPRFATEWMDDTNICVRVLSLHILRKLDCPPCQSQNQFLGRFTHSLLRRDIMHQIRPQPVFASLILPKQPNIAL